MTVGPETEMAIGTTVGMTIDQITGEMRAIKGMAIEIKIAAGPGIEIKETEAVPGKVPNPGMVHKTDMGTEGRVGTTTETGLKLDPDPHPKLVIIETGVDVTGTMSMTILPENVLMIPQAEIPIMTQKTHFWK